MKSVNTNLKAFIVIITLMLFFTFLHYKNLMPYNLQYSGFYTKQIHYSHSGIKYQIGNMTFEEKIKVEIMGEYTKGLFGRSDEFLGIIRIGNELFDYSNERVLIDENGEYTLMNENFSGSIYTDNQFKEITITVSKADSNGQNGSWSWSGEDGLMISAPCIDRKNAVLITNRLIKREMKTLVVY